ncbi:transposase [Mesorhizobium sp. M6A.T.Cr.TU.016.01.1.1]|uniref:transposase n=1 Tax=Mesorhizobium sp. M6A.T.Cr.TU.016.01.1.1 TaxID=2493677 RepID=UPI00247A2B26|nr:transposase [Mesorhizobium sp. M6A.T.Cr.TU.016.01.1.1]
MPRRCRSWRQSWTTPFPKEHRAKLLSTNPIERLNGEIADSDDLPDGIPIKNRTRFRELAGRDSD